MMTSSNGNRFNVSWGGGGSDLFLWITDDSCELLDIEYDGETLHELCGGKTYYHSWSGASGAGYLEDLAEVMKVGSYRVDTVFNQDQEFCTVGRIYSDYELVDLKVAVPYCSHFTNKEWTLKHYPTVVKFANTLVYCDFSELMDTLEELMTGEKPSGEHYTFKKRFTNELSDGFPHQEDFSIELYDNCSLRDMPDPWSFFQKELQKYQVKERGERLLYLLGVNRLKDGSYVRTRKIESTRYRGGVIGNPLETKLTAGWRRIDKDVIVRFYDKDNKVHLVAYAKASDAYGKLARRLANRVGENEEFISFVSSPFDGYKQEYVEFEVMAPKVLYLLNSADYLAEARRGLAEKIRKDVVGRARQWVAKVNDKAILEAIPDDLIITFDDSLESGNCRPGTESFRDQYFPGKEKTTAGELKKFAGNYNVMRIFHHVVVSRGLDYKAKALSL